MPEASPGPAPGSPGARWGSAITTRATGIPFKVYEPRPRNVNELLGEAERWGDRTCLAQGEREVSFSDLLALSRRGADRLAAHGVRPGDPVMLQGFNSMDWVLAFWSIVRSGGVAVLANGWWNRTVMEHAVQLVSPRLLVREGGGTFDGAPCIPLAELVGGEGGGAPSWTEPAHQPEDEAAVVVFTSGTTGMPKGAVLSHRALIGLQHMLLVATGRLPQQLDEDVPPEVTVQTSPLFHMGGIQALMNSVVTGGTLVFSAGRFDPVEVLDLMERYRATRWGGVPTMISRIVNEPSIAGRDLSSVRRLTLGGAALPPALVERVRQHFPSAAQGVSQVYGMTETGGTATVASGRDMLRHPGSVGRALPLVELRIDGDGGGDGEVLVRTPTQMTGYWNVEGDGTIDGDGWVHTGDVGHLSASGHLYLTGRSKDIIIRGGENIATAHVEAALLEHPAVLDVAVVGLPHDDLGEEVGAVVVLPALDAVGVAELRHHAARSLASFEVPQRWWFRVEPLPMSDIGKVVKRELIASWPGGQASAPG